MHILVQNHFNIFCELAEKKINSAHQAPGVKACGCAVTPNGGIVTLLEPVNHELSALRLVIRLLLPEVDDSQLRYFPHITLGYMQSIGSSDQYDEFRRSIEQAGNALSWEFVVNQVKLVNYRKRNLVEERGSFTFPLGTPDKDQRQPIPTDDEIAAALKLEPPKTGLLDI